MCMGRHSLASKDLHKLTHMHVHAPSGKSACKAAHADPGYQPLVQVPVHSTTNSLGL